MILLHPFICAAQTRCLTPSSIVVTSVLGAHRKPCIAIYRAPTVGNKPYGLAITTSGTVMEQSPRRDSLTPTAGVMGIGEVALLLGALSLSATSFGIGVVIGMALS